MASPKVFAEAAGRSGTPNLVLTMPKAYDVPDQRHGQLSVLPGPHHFHRRQSGSRAIEVRPGVRKVVHHILVFNREPGNPAPKSAFMPVAIASPGDAPVDPSKPKQPQPGFGTGTGTLIATTAPGTNAMWFAPGSAVKIKAGSTLLLQVHYTANGTAAIDLSKVGFIFAKGTAG